ncbi:AMP-binding protein [Pseudomonas tructae]|uniref:AMP-binding protein n=1 Tax=Pseudomonas tructae TaxID=2518644 RepID=A0A411MJ54_9PSED|nr:AMP-binding protein [Pseudomonas tructae]QBF26822.1 AMP-binding protein [Pseudomonas tructae]
MLQAYVRAAGSDVVGVIDSSGSHSFASIERLRAALSAEITRTGRGAVVLYASHGHLMYAALVAGLASAKRLVFIDPASDLASLQATLKSLGVSVILNGSVQSGQNLATDLAVIDLGLFEPAPVPTGESLQLCCEDYVIFTSGSTGEAKAIVQRIDALNQHIDNYVAYVGISARNRLLQLASAGWDAGLMDIFASLKTGATLCSLNPREMDFAAIDAMIVAHDLDVLHMTVPYLRAFYSPASTAYTAAKQLVIGGEIIHRSDIERFNQCFAVGSQLFNAYGPTECTTALHARINQGEQLRSVTWALDSPVDGVEVAVTFEPQQPYGEGVGELLLYSPWVARRLDSTSGQIVALTQPSPLDPQRQCYLTGDLACREPDGAIRLLGRKDSIVKINGQKVSLVHVESQLKRLSQVQEVCVIATQVQGNTALVAFVIASAPEIDESVVRQAAKAQLPAQQVPARFLLLKRFALNRNNKIDRQALAEIAAGMAEQPLDAGQAEPLWQAIVQVLGGHQPDPTLSFIDNGGDSLRALQVVAALKRKGLLLDLEALLSDGALEQLQVQPAVNKARGKRQAASEASLPNRRFLQSRGISDLDHWSQAIVLNISGDLPAQAVSQALRAVLGHHAIEQGVHDLGQLGASTDLAQAVSQTCAAISLSNQQRVCFSQLQQVDSHQLIIACHQFEVDRYSWMLLVAELDECLSQGLHCITQWHRALRFDEWLQSYQALHAEVRNTDFWQALPWQQCATSSHRGVAFPRREAFVRAELSLGAISRLPASAQGMAEISNLLLAAILGAMSEHDDKPVQKVHLLDHGRALDKQGADLNSVFGWLTLIYPMVQQVGGVELYALAERIKAYQQATQGFAHSFGNQYFGTPRAERLTGDLDCDYSYNFLGALQSHIGSRVNVHPLSVQLLHGSPSHHLEFTGYLVDGQLLLKVDYDPDRYARQDLDTVLDRIRATLE